MFQKFIYHLILIKYFLLTPVSKKKSLFPLSWEKKNYLKNPIQKKILKIPLIYLNLPQNPFNFHFRYVLDPPSPPSLPSEVEKKVTSGLRRKEASSARHCWSLIYISLSFSLRWGGAKKRRENEEFVVTRSEKRWGEGGEGWSKEIKGEAMGRKERKKGGGKGWPTTNGISL